MGGLQRRGRTAINASIMVIRFLLQLQGLLKKKRIVTYIFKNVLFLSPKVLRKSFLKKL